MFKHRYYINHNIHNMKNLVLILVATLLGVTVWATDNHKEVKEINTEKSSVSWEGKKVTGTHTGLISISEGSLEFDHGALTGGNVVIDMASMSSTDLAETQASKLLGHLKSDDFFGVANYPTAELNITDVKKSDSGYTVTGNLTIKGISKPVTFDTVVTKNGATAQIVIDRTDYNVRYGSGKFFENLGDKTIYDDFTLDVNIVF